METVLPIEKHIYYKIAILTFIKWFGQPFGGVALRCADDVQLSYI
jgi:hypothetical protein